jgi:ADP-ribose pyrophosphatase YjhB (NUDIX family)
LRTAIVRELHEEAGARVVELGELAGVYSEPARDERFHAVTVVVHALVEPPHEEPQNPLEVAEVRLFDADELPDELAHGMSRMLADARDARSSVWE